MTTFHVYLTLMLISHGGKRPFSHKELDQERLSFIPPGDKSRLPSLVSSRVFEKHYWCFLTPTILQYHKPRIPGFSLLVGLRLPGNG
jgi:hypothetical protein